MRILLWSALTMAGFSACTPPPAARPVTPNAAPAPGPSAMALDTMWRDVAEGRVPADAWIDAEAGLIHIDYFAVAYVDDAEPIEELLCGPELITFTNALREVLAGKLAELAQLVDGPVASCTGAGGELRCFLPGTTEGASSVVLGFTDQGRLRSVSYLDVSSATVSWRDKQDEDRAAALARLDSRRCHHS